MTTKVTVTDAGVYVERNCVITFDGQAFESGGAIVSPDRITAYLHANPFLPKHSEYREPPRGLVTNWAGDRLGWYRITSSWPSPNSFVNTRRFAVRITLDNGAEYYGRSFGHGCIVFGKRTRLAGR